MIRRMQCIWNHVNWAPHIRLLDIIPLIKFWNTYCGCLQITQRYRDGLKITARCSHHWVEKVPWQSSLPREHPETELFHCLKSNFQFLCRYFLVSSNSVLSRLFCVILLIDLRCNFTRRCSSIARNDFDVANAFFISGQKNLLFGDRLRYYPFFPFL